MIGIMCYVFLFVYFVDHTMKTKNSNLWLSTAQTKFEECHLQEHHISLVDIPLYSNLKVK